MAMTEQAVTFPEWTLGDRLRKAREHAGFSRDELADKLGVAKNTLWNWESGSSRPKELVKTAEKWAQATGVPAAWLLGLSPTGYRQILRSLSDTLTGPFQPELHFESRPALSPVR